MDSLVAKPLPCSLKIPKIIILLCLLCSDLHCDVVHLYVPQRIRVFFSEVPSNWSFEGELVGEFPVVSTGESGDGGSGRDDLGVLPTGGGGGSMMLGMGSFWLPLSAKDSLSMPSSEYFDFTLEPPL